MDSSMDSSKMSRSFSIPNKTNRSVSAISQRCVNVQQIEDFERNMHDLCRIEGIYIKFIRESVLIPIDRKLSIKKEKRRLTKVSSLVSVTQPTILHQFVSPSTPSQTRSDDDDLSSENRIKLYCSYKNGLLTKLELKNTEIPIKLMSILRTCIPYLSFLITISLKQCKTKSSILTELTHFLTKAHVREIILDETILDRQNYHLLLEECSELKLLSLSRCRINDQVCKEIVDRLVFEKPVANKLSVLDLSSNFITDEGAKSISEMLRTNRKLVHINLAGNQITDDGAKFLFSSLKEFILTCEEMIDKTKKSFDKMKLTLEKRDLGIDGLPQSKKPVQKRLTIAVGSFSVNNQPFHDDVFKKNGYYYCVGNLKLCSLNLAYNNLYYPSVLQIIQVLQYQSNVLNQYNDTGLTRIVLEGNKIPIDCPEYEEIQNLINMKIQPERFSF